MQFPRNPEFGGIHDGWKPAKAKAGAHAPEPRVTTVTGRNRVNRGCSWNNDAGNCRAANRNNNTPGSRNDSLGFRLASTRHRQRVRFTDRIRVLRLCPGDSSRSSPWLDKQQDPAASGRSVARRPSQECIVDRFWARGCQETPSAIGGVRVLWSGFPAGIRKLVLIKLAADHCKSWLGPGNRSGTLSSGQPFRGLPLPLEEEQEALR